MDLKTYIDTLSDEQLEYFAAEAKTSVAYVKQVASGHRRAGPKSMFNFMRASGGVLTPEALRPDLMESA